nr:MAG TPA: hypothetical protein [Caudoviricetes sp.]
MAAKIGCHSVRALVFSCCISVLHGGVKCNAEGYFIT